jgi:cysteine desulfurase
MEFYFDANATTPLSPEAKEAWLGVSENHWHNPSSLYAEAGEARQFLESLREELADLLGCEARRVVFTSGATEANNAVLRHAAKVAGNQRILISAIEHPCISDAAARLIGSERLLEVGVTEEGVFDLQSFSSVLEKDPPCFVFLMAANNETGVLQPWFEVAKACRKRSIPFHCDAAQWIGKLPSTDLHHCDFVTASAHKFGGPVGTGFMLMPSDSTLCGQIGGPQEGGHRGGTENLPAIAAMVAALKNVSFSECGGHRDQFEVDLCECLEGVRLLGAEVPRLGNTSMFVLPEHKNLRWLTRLSQRGIAVSTGSACSAGKGDPSRVMQAMGCSFEEMGRVLRVSSLPDAGAEEWEALLDALLEVRDELALRDQGASKGIPKISLENL